MNDINESLDLIHPLTSFDAFKLIQEQGLNVAIPDSFTMIEDDAFKQVG